MPGLIVDKVGGGSSDHYANPVLNLLELAEIPLEQISDKQRRYVHSEGMDYYFRMDALTGDVAPHKQENGLGWWIQDNSGVETRVENLEGLELIANQANQEFYLRDKTGKTISTISVAFLNNEGTTFVFDEATNSLKLKNDAGETLSTIPVSNFIANVAKSISLSGSTLTLRDSQGNSLSNVNFRISNISELQAVLDGKQNKLTLDGSLHLDEYNVLRNNISDFDEEFIWNAGDSQIFPIAFTPTYVTGILVNGQEMQRKQYNVILPKQIEILEPLDDKDEIKIKYQHYIIKP